MKCSDVTLCVRCFNPRCLCSSPWSSKLMHVDLFWWSLISCGSGKWCQKALELLRTWQTRKQLPFFAIFSDELKFFSLFTWFRSQANVFLLHELVSVLTLELNLHRSTQNRSLLWIRRFNYIQVVVSYETRITQALISVVGKRAWTIFESFEMLKI